MRMTEETYSPLKWVGGKRRLAPVILDHARPCTRLVEPFGGSLSFTTAFAARQPGVPIYVSDALAPMIDLWTHIRNPDVRAKIAKFEVEYCMRTKAERKPWYYELRERYTALMKRRELLPSRDQETEENLAALLFTMLRTCYNGMFRGASEDGIFNTPAGFLEAKTMHDSRLLVKFAKVIADWHISCRDYRDAIVDVVEGCLVYLDPPYKDTYDGYCGKAGFDQTLLAPFIRLCLQAGARQVIMSQSFDPDFWRKELPEAKQVTLQRREGVNRNVQQVGRPMVSELLLIVERKKT